MLVLQGYMQMAVKEGFLKVTSNQITECRVGMHACGVCVCVCVGPELSVCRGNHSCSGSGVAPHPGAGKSVELESRKEEQEGEPEDILLVTLKEVSVLILEAIRHH